MVKKDEYALDVKFADLKDLFKEEKQQIRSIATGFTFGSSGYILTNYHIVQGAKSIKINISQW